MGGMAWDLNLVGPGLARFLPRAILSKCVVVNAMSHKARPISMRRGRAATARLRQKGTGVGRLCARVRDERTAARVAGPEPCGCARPWPGHDASGPSGGQVAGNRRRVQGGSTVRAGECLTAGDRLPCVWASKRTYPNLGTHCGHEHPHKRRQKTTGGFQHPCPFSSGCS